MILSFPFSWTILLVLIFRLTLFQIFFRFKPRSNLIIIFFRIRLKILLLPLRLLVISFFISLLLLGNVDVEAFDRADLVILGNVRHRYLLIQEFIVSDLTVVKAGLARQISDLFTRRCGWLRIGRFEAFFAQEIVQHIFKGRLIRLFLICIK